MKKAIRCVIYAVIYLTAAFCISYGIAYSQQEYAKRPPWETPIIEPPPPESPEVQPPPDEQPVQPVVKPVLPPPDIPIPPDDVPVRGTAGEGEPGVSGTTIQAPPAPDLPDVGDDVRTREITVKPPVDPPSLPDVGDDTTKEIVVGRPPVESPSLPDVGDDTTSEIPRPEPIAPPSLPAVGDDATTEIRTPEAVAPPDLPDVGDDVTREIQTREAVAPPSLPDVGDDVTREIIIKETVAPPDLPDVGDDTTREIRVREPVATPDLPSVGDDVTREIPVKEAVAPPSLPSVGDDTTKEIPIKEPVESPSLPDVGDDTTREILVKEPVEAPAITPPPDDKRPVPPPKEVVMTPDITPPPDDKPVEPVQPKEPPRPPEIKIPRDDAPITPPAPRRIVPPPDDIPVPRTPEARQAAPAKPVQPPDLPNVGDDKTREIAAPAPVRPPDLMRNPPEDVPVYKFFTEFDGKWMPSIDPMLVGPKNFATLTNMRYNAKGIEGVQGYTDVNSTALQSGANDLDIDAGFHLPSIYTQGTYTIVHATGGDPAYGYVYENLTDIGSTGNFGSLLYSDSHEALGNDSYFSAAPQRSVAYANGKESCIWSGSEMRSAAFFVLSKAESGTLTALTWTAAVDTVVDGDGYDWAANGFRPGQKVHITGTTNNNRTMTIKEISSATLTFVEDLVVDESSGSGSFVANVGSGGVETSIDYSDAVATQLATLGNVAQIGAGGLDSDVKLLLHMDGDSGSTTFTDSSSSSHTVTNTVGSKATINTATKKFGTGSGYFDATTYLSIADHADWNMGSSDYTIDFWINPQSIPFTHATLFRQYADATHHVTARLHGDQTIRFYMQNGGALAEMDTTVTVGLAEWTHIAIIRGWDGSSSKWAITINGVEAETSTSMIDWADFAAALQVGGSSSDASDFKGFIDEFRITKGVARWTDDFTPPSRAYSDEAYNDFMVMSTRPLQRVKLYVQNPNTQASDLTGYLWAGNSFDEMEITDGTTSGTVALAKTGSITFGNTVTTAIPLHFRGLYLYAYLFSLDAGSAVISHVTVDAPFQKIVDIWDGVFRQPIAFQVSQDADGPYDDYTADVYDTSYPDVPIGAYLGALPSAGHIIAMFDERQVALNFKMLSGLGNTNDAVPTVYKWDGTDWIDVELLKDSTVSNLSTWKSLESTGSYHWADRGSSTENKINLFGVTGYAYKIEFDAQLSGTNPEDLIIDTVYGIPAPEPPKGFAITAPFGNRLLLINQIDANEGDRIDYCLPNAPDVWNGDLTSMGGYQSMYAGTGEPITAARQLFNRFGSNIFSTVVLTSNSTTHLLWGDGPDDFRIYPISFTVGCPAPKTMAVAESGFEIANDVRRNTAFWVSHAGPIMFDGVVIAAIPGLEAYFDSADPLYLGASSIAAANGWWNSTRKEYSFVAGTKWFTYSIDKKAWFLTEPSPAAPAPVYPNCGFPATTSGGRQYIYGGFDDGIMRMLDNGTTWDGEAIEQTVETGDFYPLQDPWSMSSIEALKIVSKILTEDVDVTVSVYTDTEGTTKADTFSYSTYAAAATERLRRHNRRTNITGWASRVKFEAETSATNQGFQPILWGYLARREYEDSVPSN
jgi:hypothetical protein